MIKQYYGTYNISHLKDSGFNHGFALYQSERGKAAVGAFFDYSMKDKLKDLGLKWDQYARCWFTPVATAQEAGKKMVELAEQLGIQAFSVALDNYFEKYDKNFEKWCKREVCRAEDSVRRASREARRDASTITKSDIKIYKGYPVVKNFTVAKTALALKLISELEDESDFPILPLDWKNEIFATETDVNNFLSCDENSEYEYEYS